MQMEEKNIIYKSFQIVLCPRLFEWDIRCAHMGFQTCPLVTLRPSQNVVTSKLCMKNFSRILWSPRSDGIPAAFSSSYLIHWEYINKFSSIRRYTCYDFILSAILFCWFTQLYGLLDRQFCIISLCIRVPILLFVSVISCWNFLYNINQWHIWGWGLFKRRQFSS